MVSVYLFAFHFRSNYSNYTLPLSHKKKNERTLFGTPFLQPEVPGHHPSSLFTLFTKWRNFCARFINLVMVSVSTTNAAEVSAFKKVGEIHKFGMWFFFLRCLGKGFGWCLGSGLRLGFGFVFWIMFGWCLCVMLGDELQRLIGWDRARLDSLCAMSFLEEREKTKTDSRSGSLCWNMVMIRGAWIGGIPVWPPLIQSGNHKWHLHLWRLHPGWSVAIELKVMFKCYKDLQEPCKLRKDLTYSTLHPSKATSTKDLIFIHKGLLWLLITLVPQQASPWMDDASCQGTSSWSVAFIRSFARALAEWWGCVRWPGQETVMIYQTRNCNKWICHAGHVVVYSCSVNLLTTDYW